MRARDSRGVVGQAQGILMERYQISAEQAFALLRRYSSHLNQRLRLVAERVVVDRSLPELAPNA
jgi:AmiR/NasT family two-component response regulator